MKNQDVCREFVNGAKDLHTTNVRICNNKLYSYNTCICERVVNERGYYNFIQNVTKYSVSTSRHQYYLRYWLDGKNVINVDNVSYGAQELRRYVKKGK